MKNGETFYGESQMSLIDRDGFFAFVDKDGSLVWTKLFGAEQAYVDTRDITVDSSNRLFITGFVHGSLDGKSRNLSDQNIFVLKANIVDQ